MENLAQIETIKDKIKAASRGAIQALYKLIFEEEGDRTNRQKLREFSGFVFNEESQEFENKITYANTLTVGDLTSICNILGLDYQGNKNELIQRIVRALMDINSLVPEQPQDDDVDEVSSNDDESVSSRESIQNDDDVNNVRRKSKLKFALNFKDVEDSIRLFDGTSDHQINRWISDFEDTAILFEWNDMQKLIFAKKSLTGLAKKFVQSEGVIKSWKKLKKSLLEEYGQTMNSADLHRMLQKRKMKKDESVQEYYIAMKEVASRGTIDEESILQYIIDGITDEESNKIVLYGAKTYKDFKERLRTYEKIRKINQEKRIKNKEFIKKDDSAKGSMNSSTTSSNASNTSKFLKENSKERSTDKTHCYN